MVVSINVNEYNIQERESIHYQIAYIPAHQFSFFCIMLDNRICKCFENGKRTSSCEYESTQYSLPLLLIFHYLQVAVLRLDKHSKLSGTDTHTELKPVLHPFMD